MTVYKRADSDFYYMSIYYEGKRIRKRTPTTRKDVAKQYEADYRAKLVRQEIGLEEPDIPLPKLIADYLNHSRVHNSPATYRRDELSLRTFREVSGAKNVSEIRSQLMHEYKEKRIESVSPRTVNIEIKTVKAMLKWAVGRGKLKENPIASVKLLKEVKSKVPRFLSKDEIPALLDAATDTYRPIILTFLKTGLQLNELVNLEWDDVDFGNGLIHVVNKEEKHYHPKGQKERSIPIASDLLPILKELKKSATSTYVFATKDGRPRQNNMFKNVKAAAERAGIKNVGVHTLRHTFASHLVITGVDLATVQKLLGHSSITTTMIYAHLAPDHLRAAVEKLKFDL